MPPARDLPDPWASMLVHRRRGTTQTAPERNLAPAIWVRDSAGWHATRVSRHHEGDITMRLEVVPPLGHGTAWIEVILAGQSAEVRATLPLRWQ